jgi:thioredoxin 1
MAESKNSKVKNIDDKTFDEVISQGVTLVDFWAPWCYPCRAQGAIIEVVAEKIGDKVQICKLNVDENGITPQKFNVSAIPTLIIFKDGIASKQFVGAQSENTLLETIESIINEE